MARIAKEFGLACMAIPLLAMTSAMSLASEQAHPLEEFGFDATANDVKRCLAQYSPDDETLARIKQHLVDLGDNDYLVRERASEALLQFHGLPIRLLQEAAQSDDIEVRHRARWILRSRGVRHSEKMLVAALRTIRQERLSGLTDEVLRVAALHDSDEVQRRAAEAIVATVTPEDEDTRRLAYGRGRLGACRSRSDFWQLSGSTRRPTNRIASRVRVSKSTGMSNVCLSIRPSAATEQFYRR